MSHVDAYLDNNNNKNISDSDNHDNHSSKTTTATAIGGSRDQGYEGWDARHNSTDENATGSLRDDKNGPK